MPGVLPFRWCLALLLVSSASLCRAAAGYESVGYGVDESFPMHWFPKPGTAAWKSYHEGFLQGCEPLARCQDTESQRLEMNREQARRQRNYTELGFGKIPAPAAAYEPAKAYWNAHRDQATEERWPEGNTYVNNWRSPTKMVSLEDGRFQPEGSLTKQAIWDGLKPVLEAWTGQKLKPTSLYGIRMYGNDAILASHLDRLPLVSSAIMQIDQDVDEPWPIEVVGHDGKAYNVTLAPGEVALYESSTIIHGRPYPLRGKFFANIFIHFIPVDERGENDPGVNFNWRKLARKGDVREYNFPEPPPHEISLAAARAASLASVAKPLPKPPLRNKKNPSPSPAALVKEEGHQVTKSGEDFGSNAFSTGSATGAHAAAAMGDLDALLEDLQYHPANLNAGDENLWTPLHEAARAANSLSVIKALVLAGADLGARTVGGASALYLAKRYRNYEAADFLESIGAPDYEEL